MKKKASVVVAILLLIPVLTFAAEFWGSKNSNKYHYPNCQWAQKIKPSNLVKFSSAEEAAKAGYVPCKVCKPPVASKTEIKTDHNFVVAGLNPSEEKRGCCSWHGGVCGCQGGRALCCDGTLSPSCGCD
ncbi:MAG: hypothetical protein LLG04_15970 [Parachlamydia sp.]|nr:hypothetical protein [Parachlamydia sp.]